MYIGNLEIKTIPGNIGQYQIRFSLIYVFVERQLDIIFESGLRSASD